MDENFRNIGAKSKTNVTARIFLVCGSYINVERERERKGESGVPCRDHAIEKQIGSTNQFNNAVG